MTILTKTIRNDNYNSGDNSVTTPTLVYIFSCIFALAASDGDLVFVCGYDGGLYMATMESFNFTRILNDLNKPASIMYDHIDEKIYYTDYDQNTIERHYIARCDLNGTDREKVIYNKHFGKQKCKILFIYCTKKL